MEVRRLSDVNVGDAVDGEHRVIGREANVDQMEAAVREHFVRVGGTDLLFEVGLDLEVGHERVGHGVNEREVGVHRQDVAVRKLARRVHPKVEARLHNLADCNAAKGGVERKIDRVGVCMTGKALSLSSRLAMCARAMRGWWCVFHVAEGTESGLPALASVFIDLQSFSY